MIRGMTPSDIRKIEEDVLGCINEHPIYAMQIAHKLQVTTGVVNDIILSLRSRGFPICGDDTYYGYYLGSEAEMKRTAEDLREELAYMKLAIRFLGGEENDDLQERHRS